MLVKERMSSPVITIDPTMPIMEALDLMKQNNIRRTPVVVNGKLVGIVSDKDLLNAAPSDATSLSVWELNYLIGRITVADVMTKKVITITTDTPIEEAAYLMSTNKIGGVPVMKGKQLVGLITETDLFKIFLDMMGAQEPGVRVTALVPDKAGELAVLTHAISEAGGEFISFGQFSGTSDENSLLTFKVKGMQMDAVAEKIAPFINELVDIRECC